MTTFVYRAGAELPTITLPWQEEITQDTWKNLDLSSGYTFTVELTTLSGTVALTKTAGITGYVGGAVVAWSTGELDLSAATYRLRFRARETATDNDRDYNPADEPRVQIKA